MASVDAISLSKTVVAGIAQWVPTNWREAIASPPWNQSMQRENVSLKNNNTWTLVAATRSILKQLITGRWVYSNKLDEYGQIVSNKSRWVARGFSQMFGINFTETFAPTPALTAIKMLVSHGVQRSWLFYSYDVSTAFLTADVAQEGIEDLH